METVTIPKVEYERLKKLEELDFDLMAKRYELTGGNIRNIALASAFLAADDGGLVTMSHLIQAIQHEYQKMGKVVMEGEFDEYNKTSAKR